VVTWPPGRSPPALCPGPRRNPGLAGRSSPSTSRDSGPGVGPEHGILAIDAPLDEYPQASHERIMGLGYYSWIGGRFDGQLRETDAQTGGLSQSSLGCVSDYAHRHHCTGDIAPPDSGQRIAGARLGRFSPSHHADLSHRGKGRHPGDWGAVHGSRCSPLPLRLSRPGRRSQLACRSESGPECTADGTSALRPGGTAPLWARRCFSAGPQR